MRAARIHAWAQSPVVEDLPAPEPRTGDVLVRVQAAALSHLDLTVASGLFKLHPDLPYVGGVEGSGVVVESDDLAVDTQVLLRGGGIGLLRDGTWSEYVRVPRKAVTPIPQSLAPDVAATFFQPTTTAYVALHDVARLAAGERVIVVGAAGAVGAQVVQRALRAGAEVVGVVGRAARLEDVPEGASAVALTDADALERLAQQRSATLLVDTIGGDALIERSRWVKQGGRAVVIGYVSGTSATVDLPSWLLDDVALLPVNMIRNESQARKVSMEIIDELCRGELTVNVESFDVREIAHALELLRSGGVRGRAVVTFDGSNG